MLDDAVANDVDHLSFLLDPPRMPIIDADMTVRRCASKQSGQKIPLAIPVSSSIVMMPATWTWRPSRIVARSAQRVIPRRASSSRTNVNGWARSESCNDRLSSMISRPSVSGHNATSGSILSALNDASPARPYGVEDHVRLAALFT